MSIRLTKNILCSFPKKVIVMNAFSSGGKATSALNKLYEKIWAVFYKSVGDFSSRKH